MDGHFLSIVFQVFSSLLFFLLFFRLAHISIKECQFMPENEIKVKALGKTIYLGKLY